MEFTSPIKIGYDGPEVIEIKKRLNKLGLASLDIHNDYFGANTKKAVWDFQVNACFDLHGKELDVSGEVDQYTWELFFSQVMEGLVTTSNKPAGIYSGPNATKPPVVNTTSLTDFRKLVLKYAAAEIGTKEIGKNSGKRVNEYQKVAGLGSGAPWCMAFVLWCIKSAAEEAGITIEWIRPRDIKLLKTGHCQTFRRWAAENGWVTTDPRKAKPGDIFIMVFENDYGHTGLITKNVSKLYTIEGNTGSNIREGDGVYSKSRLYSATPYIIQLPF